MTSTYSTVNHSDDVETTTAVARIRHDAIVIQTDNVIPLRGFTARDELSSALGSGKEALTNNFLRLTGVFGLVQSILFIIIASYAGPGPQIACVFTGNICLITGLAMSCGLTQLYAYVIRIAVVTFMSVISVVCAVISFLELSKIEACVLRTNSSLSPTPHYKYFGEDAYYDDALHCSKKLNSEAQGYCSCVTQPGGECISVSFSTNCEPIVSTVPILIMAGMILTIVNFIFIVFSATAFFFSMKATSVPVPSNSTAVIAETIEISHSLNQENSSSAIEPPSNISDIELVAVEVATGV